MSAVTIVGTGYVGLVTGACLADLGHRVACVDLDPERVADISTGKVPFHEPGLDELVQAHIGTSLSATTDLDRAVRSSDFTFITVGTPQQPDGRIDLSQVESAVKAVGKVLADHSPRHVVVMKSTVVPGTTAGPVTQWLESSSGKQVGSEVGLAVNPEFLTEGTAVVDFMQPDRIVVGALDDQTAGEVVDLFAMFEDARVIITTPSTAEMIKYASNTLLSTLISFSNQVADLGAAIGNIDVVDVMEGVTSSRYITVDGSPSPIAAFLAAGCGFGGSCLPKDTAALIAAGKDAGVRPMLLEAVLDVNAERSDRVMSLIRKHFPELRGVPVTVLGMAFKPDTDDVRESPAFPVVRRLLDEGALVSTHDPKVDRGSLPDDLRSRIADHHSQTADAIASADVIVIMTSWPEYSDLPDLLRVDGASPLVVDGRRILTPGSVDRYEGIGR